MNEASNKTYDISPVKSNRFSERKKQENFPHAFPRKFLYFFCLFN